MKKAFVFSLLATLAITGCQAELEELIPENNEQEVITQEPAKVFTAIVDDDFSGDTKTSLDGSGNVLWKQYDQVSIFAASTVNEQYQVSDDSDGKTAATLNKIPAGGFVAGTDIDNNVAFYPYASTVSIAKSGSNYVISDVELPATQTYATGSFGNGAFPMAAVTSSTEDMNLKFKNVLGGLKLQLKGTATITSITVTGNNNEILYGDAEVTMAYGGVPSITLSDASAKTVTLDCGAGVTLDSETATPFIIALPPMTMTGGFTVVVTDSESKQMEIKTTKSQTIPRSNLLKMPAVNYVGEVAQEAAPLKFTSAGSTSISLTKTGSPDAISLEYKLDAGEWTSYTVGDVIPLTNGQELSFRAGAFGNSSFSQSSSNYYQFTITGSGTVAASENIMSLLNKEEGMTIPTSYCFYGLFKSCSKLTSSPQLPASTLAQSCYCCMFQSCTGLTTAPALPATTLAGGCYSSMFSGCTSLTTAPELPATTLANSCYSSMFGFCSNLTSAPELPATTLANSCYRYMFYECDNLTTAPELPATILADYCYAQMFASSGLATAPNLPATTMAENCYNMMFYDCSSLTTVPDELPATTLANSCYASMFNKCTSLTTAPALPATTLANSCYASMFQGCSNLTTAPALPATTLANSCYSQMFMDSRLTTAPALPATTLAKSCYYSMFRNSKIATAPELPATTLADGCYSSMFNDCVLLTTVPNLPATVLAARCYHSMFYNCRKITTAPDLPAISLESGCYYQMFYGCTDLNYIKALFTTTPSSSYTNNWVAGVSATGTFVKSSSATWDVTGNSGVPSGWTIETESQPFTITSTGTTSIAINKSGTPDAISLEYKVDDGEWTSYTVGNAIDLTDGQEVSFRAGASGNSSFSQSYSNYYQFVISGSGTVSASGNIMSLLNREGGLTIPTSYCFASLFEGCTSLTTAPTLPATTLAESCYQNMFKGCTGLITAPALPATTVASFCYLGMFEGCTGLTTAPALPATSVAWHCYNRMFYGCTGLTTAPALPATTLNGHCYESMFEGCTGLTTAPALPATTVIDYCYYRMFYGCTGLTTAPALPATTLAESCYYRMFEGCNSLNYIKMLATDISAYNCLSYWVKNVAATGTFVKNSAATWTKTGTDGVPSGWTIETE